MKTLIKKAVSAVLFASLLLSACSKDYSFIANYSIIPLPQKINRDDEKGFVLNGNTKIQYPQGNDAQRRNAEFLAQYIRQANGLNLEITYETVPLNVIILKNDYKSEKSGAYKICANEHKLSINGKDEAGTFYGIQTLRKSLIGASDESEITFPAVTIEDYPRFAYRGMHLDVVRHLFTIDEVKTYIDILALHNVNVLHWHLTDDQGWRIEIKSRPKLTEIGAFRDETVIGRNTGVYDGIPHGGFFTQEEVKDIIAYAQERFITIIPEVDLPGHMLAALASYPELGCTGGPYKTSPMWGIFDDVLCAGNDEIYRFLEDVFTEIILLFPSEYIHIGGDECPKTRWETCPKCQAKIKELGLKSDAQHTAEQYLQSYVMQRMENFINGKGRKVIGWDEILEGGLGPNVTVMSWRGIRGGVEAAKQHHDVIMSPTNPLYFDYYQSRAIEEEPFGFNGYNPVINVYAFNPLPDELTEEEQKHILGVQANLWTEYIAKNEHLQYMLLPRLAALSEIQWLEPEKKNYKDFLLRAFRMTKLYDKSGYNYAKHIFDIDADIKPDAENKLIRVVLSTPDNAPVFYTLHGNDPTEKSHLYEKPLEINESCELRAIAIREDGNNSRVLSRTFNVNKATFKNIVLENAPAPRFTFDGAPMLADGLKGGGIYSGGDWLGFWRDDFVASIDLETDTEISELTIGTFIDLRSWVFGPTEILAAVSADGENFEQVFHQVYPEEEQQNKQREIRRLTASFEPIQARFVKITAKTIKSLPSWHNGAGKPGNLFVDEIEIY